MKTKLSLTLGIIAGAILIASSPANAAPSNNSINSENHVIAMEIFWMSLNDPGFEFPMVASINNGTVTLVGPSYSPGEQKPDQSQRNKLDGKIRGLAGVHKVKDELNTYTTAPAGNPR
ncbi:MAG TPA: hypothetical protein VGI03_08300 [Verrucomicrobiae bacterium]